MQKHPHSAYDESDMLIFPTLPFLPAMLKAEKELLQF